MVITLYNLLFNIRSVVVRIYEPPFEKQRTFLIILNFEWRGIIIQNLKYKFKIAYMIVDFLNSIFALWTSPGILPPA